MNLEGKTALVTGANRGIGFEIARTLADDHGVRVLCAARDEEKASQAADEIGHGACGVVLDLSSADSVLESGRRIVRGNGPIDILVNNAGILHSPAALEASPEEMLSSLTVNAVAPLMLIRAVAPDMQARGWGRIVNLSSGWGSFAEELEGPTPYAVSKAALNAVTVCVARELGESVKVNAACPGWVRTDMGGADADRSPRQGAETPVWLATLPDNGPTGGFFRDRHPINW